jgi:hypothetical protein
VRPGVRRAGAGPRRVARPLDGSSRPAMIREGEERSACSSTRRSWTSRRCRRCTGGSGRQRPAG